MSQDRKVSVGKLPSLPKITQLERLLRRPSWADPAFMVYTSELVTTPVDLAGVTIEVIAPANPRRWAIGFQLSLTGAVAVAVSWSNRPDLVGQQLTARIQDNYFTIFNHGPMVTNEWYAFSAGPDTIQMTELEAQGV